jgi:hypothetical protein
MMRTLRYKDMTIKFMSKNEKDKLTSILFAQSVAGARNVKPIERLEAFHNDIGAVILGAPKSDCAQASWNLTKVGKEGPL